MSYQKHGSSDYYLKSKTRMGSASTRGIRGKGHGYNSDRYPGINRAVNFRQSDKITAEMAFSQRSKRSQAQDLIRMATITPDIEVWLKNPNRYDFAGVDTVEPNLVFSHKGKKAQAQDLARAAKQKVALEVWINDTSHTDLKGVDTKNAKSQEPKKRVVRKFKVMPKEEAKKLELKKAESEKTEEKKHALPTKEEIVERAQEIHMEKEAKEGLPTVTAEEKELKKSGEFEEARAELMRGEKSKADSQIENYVHDLNSELESMGYRVVPID